MRQSSAMGNPWLRDKFGAVVSQSVVANEGTSKSVHGFNNVHMEAMGSGENQNKDVREEDVVYLEYRCKRPRTVFRVFLTKCRTIQFT